MNAKHSITARLDETPLGTIKGVRHIVTFSDGIWGFVDTATPSTDDLKYAYEIGNLFATGWFARGQHLAAMAGSEK